MMLEFFIGLDYTNMHSVMVFFYVNRKQLGWCTSLFFGAQRLSLY
jgi:hypothetical protein